MAPASRRVEKTSAQLGKDQKPDPRERDFPPLRERIENSRDRWEIIKTEMARHQDVLADLADS